MIDVLGNLHNQMKLASTSLLLLITDIAKQGEVHGSTFNNDAHVSLFCNFCVTCTFDAKCGESNLL